MLQATPPQMDMRVAKLPGSSSRILYDVPCLVCQDHSSGKHYGIFACDGCAGFFKRSIRRSRQYVCKAKTVGSCVVDKTHRNQCRACRLTKCMQAGMNREAVQHERGPRNSTIRRQMANYFKDPCDTTTDIDLVHRSGQPGALDLALPKSAMEEADSARQLMHSSAAAAFLAAQALMPKLNMGVPLPLPLNSAETVCESAARLLFMNVQWANSVPAFTRLHYKDQLMLLEESWRELFVLGAAQFLLPIELSQVLLAAANSDHSSSLMSSQEVQSFQDTILKFKQLQVDAHEYACLRAIVLFKTCFDGGNVPSSSASSSSNETRSLIGAAEVAALQDATQATLSKYISTAHPTQPFRFGKLLLLLPALRAVSSATIEDLFFRRTIGNIPIERIICDMYKARDL